MEFFDSNCFIGLPMHRMLKPCPTADDLVAAMDRSGIAKALVWHVAQRDYSEVVGNQMASDAIAPHRDRLVGCWGVIPPHTGEMPAPGDLPDRMLEAGVKALRLFPMPRKYVMRAEAFADVFDVMFERGIPLFLPVSGGAWQPAYDLLRDFPNLTCVISNVGDWGPDRFLRPLIESFPNVSFEMSEYTLDGGVESFVEKYGAERLLFGTGFPAFEHGGPMLCLRHSEISEDDKRLIAYGNLEKLLSWA